MIQWTFTGSKDEHLDNVMKYIDELPDWKIGQWCIEFFPDINFCALGIVNILRGNFCAPECLCVFLS